MIKLIIISITIILIELFLQKSSRYVSFTYNNLLIEIPAWLIITIILIFMFFNIWLLTIAFNNWLQNRRTNKSINYAKKAFFSLIAGQPATAEHYALNINTKSRFGWLGLFLAAKAAQQQFAWEKCYKYIMKAEILATQSSSIISSIDSNQTATFGIMKAELYYNQGEYNKCLYELKKLHKQFPRHKTLLLQLITVYQTLNDWQGLIKLLPTLKKHQFYNNTFNYQQLELMAHKNRIQQLTETGSVDSIVQCFKQSPKLVRHNSQFIVVYVTCLIKFKYYDLAEKTIKIYLSDQLNHWNVDLIKIYGLIKTNNINNQIKAAEAWLTIHPSDETLLLTLGRLCIQAELLGKAQNYLERSLNIQENPDCYAELGRLAGLLGEPEKSLSCYQKGLLRITEVVDLQKHSCIL